MPSSVQFQRIDNSTNSISHKQSLTRSPRAAVTVPDAVAFHHSHCATISPNQCCSFVTQTINADVAAVLSLVRRFDNPQAYKHFLKSCHVIGDVPVKVGTLREVRVVSGLPAATSTERLEILDEERHVLSFSVVGGDHRLMNYRSVTTLHANGNGNGEGTVVVESNMVDVPAGNSKEETCKSVQTGDSPPPPTQNPVGNFPAWVFPSLPRGETGSPPPPKFFFLIYDLKFFLIKCDGESRPRPRPRSRLPRPCCPRRGNKFSPPPPPWRFSPPRPRPADYLPGSPPPSPAPV